MKRDHDHELNKRWVDEQMKNLDPPSTWHPDASQAFERLMNGREMAGKRGWNSILLAVAVVGAIFLVVALLPWRARLSSTIRVETPREHSTEGVEPAGPRKSSPNSIDSEGYAVIHDGNGPPPNSTDSNRSLPGTPARELKSPGSGNSEITQPFTIIVKHPVSNPSIPLGKSPASQQGSTQPLCKALVPHYTKEAMTARIVGTVVLASVVRKDGTVRVTKVVKGLGYGLDESATVAAEESKCKPGTVDGVPVDVSIRMELEFRLY